MAYTSNSPASSSYNNVISLGITYSWENGLNPLNSNAKACPGLGPNIPKEYIKRTQETTIEALNLNLENPGGQNIANLAAAQNAYSNTKPQSIYANGQFVGNGRLSSYSMSEGSLTNASITTLGYTMEDGGPDKKDPNAEDDKDEDPLSRTESITVSRDIKAKSYKITHSYSISFGDNFDAVTDHPFYAGNSSYETVAGRLALGQKEANAAIYTNMSDYNDYIDLSAYTVGNGFDLKLINDACSGVFYTSDSTSNYINGDFSLTKNTELKYTGSNMDAEASSHEVDFTMNYSEVPADGYRCAKVTMQGSVKGKEGKGECSNETKTVAEAAASGYAEFVTAGKAEAKLQAFYNSIKGNIELMGIYATPLNPGIINLKKTECVPSVDKGASNNGTIGFSFDMDNCPGRGTTDAGVPYTKSETTSLTYSWQKDCNQAERKVTTSSVNGSVAGVCGLQVDGDGVYVRWNTVSSTFQSAQTAAKATAQAAYNGDFSADLSLRSSSTTVNEYSANGSYSFTYSDAPKACEQTSKFDTCKKVIADEQTTEAKDRKVRTVTTDGIIIQKKGKDLPTKTVSLEVGSFISDDADNPCSQDLDGFLNTTMQELNSRKPQCIINTLTWTYNKQFDQNASITATMGGIDL